MIVFQVDGSASKVIKAEYCPDANIKGMQTLQRILKKETPASSILDKNLQFFNIALKLERSKMPSVKNVYPYSFKIDGSNIFLDIECDEFFNREFNDNMNPQKTKYPKNLYVALNVEWNNQTYSILRDSIPFDTYKGIDTSKQLLSCAFSDFEVDLNVADHLLLTDEQINIFNESLKASDVTLNAIEKILQEQISADIKLIKDKVMVGLCEDNLALVQTSKELENLNSSIISPNSLLNSFLCNEGFDNKLGSVYKEQLLQVKDLDESQKEAVTRALNDKLSVVTGPPGCGKTQVILNIIANALLQEKKVLVSSKNNKAVDNVKERFDIIDGVGYLMRFGSKLTIKEKTIVDLDAMIHRMNLLQENGKGVYKNLKSHYDQLSMIINKNKHLLIKKKELEKEQEQLKSEILLHKKNLDLENRRWERQLQSLLNDNKDVAKVSHVGKEIVMSTMSSFRIHLNILLGKYSGLRKLFFNKKKYAAVLLNLEDSQVPLLREYICTIRNKADVRDFKKVTEIISQYQDDINCLERIISYIDNFTVAENAHKLNKNSEIEIISSLQDSLSSNQSMINSINEKEYEIKNSIANASEKIKEMSAELIKVCIYSHLGDNGAIKDVMPFRNYLPDNIPWRSSDMPVFSSNVKRYLKVFPLNAVTSLSVKSAFPLDSELFDLVIIDEASQCDIASAIPLIYRTKQLCVIGDPLQLKHITSINMSEEKTIKDFLGLSDCPYLQYKERSLWDYSAELISKVYNDNRPVVLTEHYRCQPRIIGYSNDIFYTRRLGTTLNVRTKDTRPDILPKDIIWIDIKGKQKSDNINVNEEEALQSVSLARKLVSEYKDISIGIVTPFKDQAEKINSLLTTDLRNIVVADTVHKFQGDEKDIMIYSLVVTDNSPEKKIVWIDQIVPNLVNVAVTRAKQTLYVLGNREYIKRMSPKSNPLGYLAYYANPK